MRFPTLQQAQGYAADLEARIPQKPDSSEKLLRLIAKQFERCRGCMDIGSPFPLSVCGFEKVRVEYKPHERARDEHYV